MFDGVHRFLDGARVKDQNIAFTSFPRSGSAFCRRFIESVCGVSTGSTISIHISGLQLQGFKGEGVNNSSVFVVRSHHPIYLQMATTFKSNKVIRVVRHPIDVFPSYANMLNALSHARKCEFSFEKDYPEWWDWFVRKQTKQLKRMFETLYKHCHEDKKNPMHIVRYEDLVLNPRETMLNLFKFILAEDDLEGTNAMRRVEATVAKGKKAHTTYAHKKNTGVLNANWDLFTEDQRKYIMEELGEHLWYYGYAKHPSEENPTGFFEFENPTEAMLSKHYQFRRDNEKCMADLLDKDYKAKDYIINQDEIFDVLDKEDTEKIQIPGKTHAFNHMATVMKQNVVPALGAEGAAAATK